MIQELLQVLPIPVRPLIDWTAMFTGLKGLLEAAMAFAIVWMRFDNKNFKTKIQDGLNIVRNDIKGLSLMSHKDSVFNEMKEIQKDSARFFDKSNPFERKMLQLLEIGYICAKEAFDEIATTKIDSHDLENVLMKVSLKSEAAIEKIVALKLNPSTLRELKHLQTSLLDVATTEIQELIDDDIYNDKYMRLSAVFKHYLKGYFKGVIESYYKHKHRY